MRTETARRKQNMARLGTIDGSGVRAPFYMNHTLAIRGCWRNTGASAAG